MAEQQTGVSNIPVVQTAPYTGQRAAEFAETFKPMTTPWGDLFQAGVLEAPTQAVSKFLVRKQIEAEEEQARSKKLSVEEAKKQFGIDFPEPVYPRVGQFLSDIAAEKRDIEEWISRGGSYTWSRFATSILTEGSDPLNLVLMLTGNIALKGLGKLGVGPAVGTASKLLKQTDRGLEFTFRGNLLENAVSNALTEIPVHNQAQWEGEQRTLTDTAARVAAGTVGGTLFMAGLSKTVEFIIERAARRLTTVPSDVAEQELTKAIARHENGMRQDTAPELKAEATVRVGETAGPEASRVELPEQPAQSIPQRTFVDDTGTQRLAVRQGVTRDVVELTPDNSRKIKEILIKSGYTEETDIVQILRTLRTAEGVQAEAARKDLFAAGIAGVVDTEGRAVVLNVSDFKVVAPEVRASHPVLTNPTPDDVSALVRTTLDTVIVRPKDKQVRLNAMREEIARLSKKQKTQGVEQAGETSTVEDIPDARTFRDRKPTKQSEPDKTRSERTADDIKSKGTQEATTQGGILSMLETCARRTTL